MWEIWANQMSPKALKSCPKSNISPNLVTLVPAHSPLSKQNQNPIFAVQNLCSIRSRSSTGFGVNNGSITLHSNTINIYNPSRSAYIVACVLCDCSYLVSRLCATSMYTKECTEHLASLYYHLLQLFI